MEGRGSNISSSLKVLVSLVDPNASLSTYCPKKLGYCCLFKEEKLEVYEGRTTWSVAHDDNSLRMISTRYYKT